MRDAQETHPGGRASFGLHFFLSSPNFLILKKCWWDLKSDCVALRLEFSIPRDWGHCGDGSCLLFLANVTKVG